MRILAVVGNIHIHAAGSITQIEACAVLHIRASVSIRISTVSAVVIDKAAVSEVACDSVLIKAVAGDGDLGTSVNEVSANHCPGICKHTSSCLCIAFADGIQLDSSVVTDIGGSVLRFYGGVDICPVMAGDIRFVDIGVCVKIDILCAVCIHIRAQRRTLGVRLTIDIEAADISHDIHNGAFNDCRIRLGTFADDIAVIIKHSGADVCICIQRNGVINVGFRCGAEAGRIGAAVAVDSVFRAVSLDIDRTEPVADFCGTNVHCGCGGHIHGNIDLRHGNAALGIDAGGGGDDVSPARLSNDIQRAKVCLDIRTVQNIDGCCTHQRIICIDTAGCNESGAFLGGLCSHDCIGNGMGCEVEVGIHCTIKVDDIFHVHSVLALGLIQIDDAAGGTVIAGNDTLCFCVIFCGDADAAQVGCQFGITIRIGPGVIVAFRRQCLVGYITNHGCLCTGLDVCCCGALVVGTDDNVPLTGNGAAGNTGLCALSAVCTGANSCFGYALLEGHTGRNVSGLSNSTCVGIRNRFHTDTQSIQMDAGQVSVNRIVGIGIAAHVAEGNKRDLVRHNGFRIRTGNGAGKDLDIGSGHGVFAAACNVCGVGTDRLCLCFGFFRLDQAE